jgi:tetrahydromethanopterin S-methyltransferase subunit E
VNVPKRLLEIYYHIIMVVSVRQNIYREWVSASTLIKALVGFFSLLIMCILLITIAVDFAIQHPFFIVVLASPLAFVLLVFWNYRGIRIKVTTESLRIHYGFFNHKRIPLGDIVSCEPTKASFGRYGGIGVRYGTDGSWAYTTSLGDAVKIILRKGKPFVFSSNKPKKICNIINQMKNVL